MSTATSARRPSRPPRRTPAATGVALVVALLLVAVAVVAVRDLVVSQGWSGGSPWAPSLVAPFDALSPSAGLAIAGGAVALLGLVVMVLALLPGRRTHKPVGSDDDRIADDSDLWLTPGAVAALAHELTDRSAGIAWAEVARSNRRRVVIDVETYRGAEHAPATVQEVARADLGAATATRIDVRARNRGEETP